MLFSRIVLKQSVRDLACSVCHHRPVCRMNARLNLRAPGYSSCAKQLSNDGDSAFGPGQA
jgi:hypothetical protein